MKREIRG